MNISIYMRLIVKVLVVTVIVIIATQPLVQAQDKEDIMFKAMKDEMNRSMTKLTLDKYKPPFFLAYQVSDLKTLYIKASMGSIIQSQQDNNRSNYLRLMVGDYSLNDENFNGGGGGAPRRSLPRSPRRPAC